MNPLFGARVVEHLMKGAAAVMSLAASRTASQAMARHPKLVRTMTRSAATAQGSGAAARLAQRGLKPIHSRAMNRPGNPGAVQADADLPEDQEPAGGSTSPRHSKLESTVRYLGIEVDDALKIVEQTEV